MAPHPKKMLFEKIKCKLLNSFPREGQVDILNYLLDCVPDLWNTVSNNGRTPLHTAGRMLDGQNDGLTDFAKRK